MVTMSQSPSLPSEFDHTLSGKERLSKLIKDGIAMVRVYQHKVRKYMKKLKIYQQRFDAAKFQADHIEFMLTARNGEEQEWDNLLHHHKDKSHWLSKIHEAKMVIDDTLEQIDQEMNEAWTYMNLLEDTEHCELPVAD